MNDREDGRSTIEDQGSRIEDWGRPQLPSSSLNHKAGRYHHGSIAINRITTGYARTLGLRLLRGRLFDEHDTADAPMVALISDTAARKYWPNEDPIGRRFTVDYTSWFPWFYGSYFDENR
jgi:MacB-like periplasmic core domain